VTGHERRLLRRLHDRDLRLRLLLTMITAGGHPISGWPPAAPDAYR
jgi:hypothetical protein